MARKFGASEAVTLLNHPANVENILGAAQNQASNLSESAGFHQKAGMVRRQSHCQ
jgi:hypothetical protein